MKTLLKYKQHSAEHRLSTEEVGPVSLKRYMGFDQPKKGGKDLANRESGMRDGGRWENTWHIQGTARSQ